MITIYLVISALSAWTTFVLIKQPNISPTRASTSVSLFGFIFLYSLNFFYPLNVEQLSLVIFGSSFVGMCSHKIFKGKEIFLGSILFTVTYLFVLPSFSNLGGSMGFAAFVSIVISRQVFRGLNTTKS